MATVNLGRIKPVFRGAYSGSTAYVVDDIVTHGNETFICIQAGTGNATSNASYWTKLAAKGTDGTDVGTTITTQGDILYRDASGLARLAAGTAGQALITNGTGANPSWGSAGTLLKVYNSQYFGGTTVNTTSDDVDISTLHSDYNNFKIDLTPQSASSKFLIQTNIAIQLGTYGACVIKRTTGGTTSLLTGGTHVGNGTGDPYHIFSQYVFDEPNTTAQVNYRVHASRHSSGNVVLNDIGGHTSDGTTKHGGMKITVFEFDGSNVTNTSS